MRLRASVDRLPLSASRSTLRYARHRLLPAPAAVASVWQMLSAPRRPPRFPVALFALVTKKPIVGPVVVGAVLLLEQVVAAATASVIMTMRFMATPYNASTTVETQRFT